jgi:membrane protease subunit (stomatin/prohibitin family)
MMRRRRRPLARAAMIGGVAYTAGKSGAKAGQAQAQQAQQAQAQQQQAAPPPPPAASAGGETDLVAKLTELKGLVDSGALTQEEFEAAKQKLLAG